MTDTYSDPAREEFFDTRANQLNFTLGGIGQSKMRSPAAIAAGIVPGQALDWGAREADASRLRSGGAIRAGLVYGAPFPYHWTAGQNQMGMFTDLTAYTFTIVDQTTMTPIPGATIVIYSGANQTGTSLIGTADASGDATFNPPFTIASYTVSANGYVAFYSISAPTDHVQVNMAPTGGGGGINIGVLAIVAIAIVGIGYVATRK